MVRKWQEDDIKKNSKKSKKRKGKKTKSKSKGRSWQK